jgi:predicted phosphodiesterase
MKFYITGDTHADFKRFGSQFFDDQKCYIIICGDFGGVWDNSNTEKYWLNWFENKKFTILFVDGNHENFDLLTSFPVTEWNGGKVHVIRKNIIHLMRGQVFTVNGIRFFTFGGGQSHDIQAGILNRSDPDFPSKRKRLDRERALYRINHESWWKEELPSEEEMAEGLANLDKVGNQVDFVISHSAPSSVVDIFSRGLYAHDILTDYLEKIKERISFKTWFFGHYHETQMIGQKFVMLYESVVDLQQFLSSGNED